jgi:hypothetical protein
MSKGVTPLSTEARRFVRLARHAIDAARGEAIRIFDPGADTLREAWEAFGLRLAKPGPVKLKRELIQLKERLNAIPCCRALFWLRSSRNHAFTAVIPVMAGHPMQSVDEPDTITMDQLWIETARRGTSASLQLVGAITSHAIGRLGERTDLKPDDAPAIIRSAGFASIILRGTAECSIALPIAEHGNCRADDAFLVGILRQIDKEMFFADWRTVLPRRWLARDMQRFGDTLADIVAGKTPIGEGRKALPLIAPRQDYITAARNAA